MTVDTRALEQAVRDYALDRAGELAEAFVDVVRGHAPRRTGELADSVEVDSVDVTANGATAHVVVGAEYGAYVNDGTGIYGPDGTPITPTSSSVLVFDWPAAGGLVFARSVKGSEPTHFWQRSLDAWPSIVHSL